MAGVSDSYRRRHFDWLPVKLAALAAPFLPIPLEVVSHSSTRSMTDDSACSTRRKPNIFDNMMSMMEKYANNLEALVDERTEQLLEEKKKTGKIPFSVKFRIVR